MDDPPVVRARRRTRELGAVESKDRGMPFAATVGTRAGAVGLVRASPPGRSRSPRWYATPSGARPARRGSTRAWSPSSWATAARTASASRPGVTFKHGRARQHDPLGRVHSLGASRGGLAARPELAAGPARHHRDEVRRPIGAHHSETAPTERGCRHMCPARHRVVEQCVHAQPREEGQAAVNTINTLQPPTGGNHEHTANDATPPRVRGGCRFQK